MKTIGRTPQLSHIWLAAMHTAIALENMDSHCKPVRKSGPWTASEDMQKFLPAFPGAFRHFRTSMTNWFFCNGQTGASAFDKCSVCKNERNWKKKKNQNPKRGKSSLHPPLPLPRHQLTRPACPARLHRLALQQSNCHPTQFGEHGSPRGRSGGLEEGGGL